LKPLDGNDNANPSAMPHHRPRRTASTKHDSTWLDSSGGSKNAFYAFDILALDGDSCRFPFASRSFRGFWRGGRIDVVALTFRYSGGQAL
jgi:hypothetical protein